MHDRGRLGWLGMILVAATAAPVWGKGADTILAARTETDKTLIFWKSRGDLDGPEVLTLLRKEKTTRVVGLALGGYLEGRGKGKAVTVDAREAAQIMRAAAARPDLAARAVAMAATGPAFRPLIDELLGDPKGTSADRLLAARILACFATIHSLEEQASSSAAKRKQLDGIDKPVAALLGGPSEDVIELALVAAAYLRITAVKNQVLALEQSASAEVRAGRLLYQARLGLPVETEQVRSLFAQAPPVSPLHSKSGASLMSFDLQVPAWCLACQALGEIKKETYLEELHRALDHGDLRIQIDAAKALERVAAARSVPVLLRKLPTAPWPVKVSLLAALGAIPATEAVEPLIAQLERETGRFRLDVVHALSSIAGAQHGQTALQWRQWWNENKDSFRPDPALTRTFRGRVRVQDLEVNLISYQSFFDLAIVSDRLIFVPDTSNSMKGAKIEALKKEMTKLLQTLQPGVRYNVVSFGGLLEVMQPSQLMTAAQVKMALEKVDKFQLTLGTRTFDALDLALTFPEVDTLVLLSDGAPAGGQFISWNQIVSAVALMNRYRPMAIHTLEYNAGGKGGKRTAGMKELADRNAGRALTPKVE